MSPIIRSASGCLVPRRWLLAGTMAAVALGGCQWGKRTRDFGFALTPSGADVAFRVRGEGDDRRGELFAVDSLGVTIRSETLVLVRWSRLSGLGVDKLGSEFRVVEGERISAQKREKLALVSRFPQGLSGPLLDQVLATLKQGALEEIK